MIEFTSSKGKWKKTNTWFQRVLAKKNRGVFHKYGQMGVDALRNNTPVNTGVTALSWEYEVVLSRSEAKIIWYNTNVIDEWCNVAVILQHGHATGTGGWVEGIDYINPALAPVFNSIKDLMWKEVTS